MKSFWGLIPRNILKNKKRNFLIGVSIMLAAALITSLSIIESSIIKNAEQGYIDASGGIYDVMAYQNGYKGMSKFKEDEIFKKATIVTNVGIHKVKNSKTEISIDGYDENAKYILNFKLLKGKYPEKENEIAIESWILDEIVPNYKLGDKISLSYENNKKLTGENEFTLVGVIKYTREDYLLKNEGKAYITNDYAKKIVKDIPVEYSAYGIKKDKYSLKDVDIILKLTKDYEQMFIRPNDIKEFMLDGIKVLNGTFKMIFWVVGVVAAIVIYNIFNIMVTERTKDFGIFRALGISPEKIKILVILEGIALGVIFIPIGILIGGAFITLLINNANISNFYIPKDGLKWSCIVGFFSIIGGSYFPAKRASKITPMEAIFSNNNLELKGHMLKPGLEPEEKFRKNFSFISNMAYLNLIRNKKRFITTVISFNITIIMFFGVNFLIGTMDPIKDFKNKFGGDFIIQSSSIEGNQGISKENIENIAKMPSVNIKGKEKYISNGLEVPKDNVTSAGCEYLKASCGGNKLLLDNLNKGIYRFYSDSYGYEKDEIEKLKEFVRLGEIDYEKMRENPYVILIQDKYSKVSEDDFVKFKIPLYDENGEFKDEDTVEFKVIAVLDKSKVNLGQRSITAIMSNEAMERYLNIKNYRELKVSLSDENQYGNVKTLINKEIKNSKEITLLDYKSELEKLKKDSKDQLTILYSFIAIVFIVVIINIINVMNMSVILRKKDIGMLRAIGIGNKGVKEMILKEGLFYGIVSGLSGSILGTILVYILFDIVKKSENQIIAFHIPIVSIVLSLIISITVCAISALLPLRKVFKDSIIDSLRSIE
ncbi:ABC transporter permease [Clostridium sp. ATCC 25772]|uniref:ABC transporter permease n=1 Tax=Clostridium sp. ATCC 25772 TaxID=1676991 RepID=UPI000784849B|nr:ABC transporter permease [Clostridium sp. ATCC 25772]